MKKIILLITAFAIMFSGCSSIDPTPKRIDISKIKEKMRSDYSLSIKVDKGDTLKGVIAKIQKKFPNKVFIDKIEDDIVFDQNLPKMTPEEFSKYIRVNFGKIVVLRKYSEKIFAIEEIKTKDKTSSVKVGTYKVPNLELTINGEFTYEEVFNILREQGINIYVDTNKPFDYSKKAGEFSGTVKEFLTYIGAKEKLFVTKSDTGIKLKDNEIITYNLKIPKVRMSPALSPDGSKTAVTVNGVMNNEYNSDGTKKTNNQDNNTEEDGSIFPIDDLKLQLAEMLDKGTKYSLNMTQGTLSINGNYDSIKVADKLVNDFNTIYGKGIKLELHVYEVTLDNSKSFGIDYSFLKSELINNSITNTVNLGTNLTKALTIGETNDNGITIGLGKYTGPTITDGTTSTSEKVQSLIFNYLNKFGRTTVITKPTLETINNLPVRLDVVDSLDYVYNLSQSSTNSAVANVDTPVVTSVTTEPEIRTVTTGFSLILHPKVQGDFINIAIKNVSSALNGLLEYKYGRNSENVIRLKDVSAREFDETVKVKEGEIAIIGGYMYEKKNSLKNGMPYTDGEDSALDALTSAKESSKNKVEIVITISAKVI